MSDFHFISIILALFDIARLYSKG